MDILKNLFFFVVLISNAQASLVPCAYITTLPFTITTHGNYCLAGNLVNYTDQNAITIAASGVVLDLQKFTIDTYNTKSDNSSFGIYSLDRHDITIKNGIIRGFMYGIYLSDKQGSDSDPTSSSGGHLIDNVTITGSSFRGIRMEGAYNIVRNSTITAIGGTTIFKNAFAIGIETIGPGAVIEKNTVSEIYGTGTGESVAVSFSNNSSGSSATGNRIINEIFENPTYLSNGDKFGVWVGGNLKFQTKVFIRNNKISNMDYGVTFSSPTTGYYGNNIIEQSKKCDYVICSLSVSTSNHKGLVCCNEASYDKVKLINQSILKGEKQ